MKVGQIHQLQIKLRENKMNEQDFYQFVKKTIVAHPDWIDGTMTAVKHGAVERVGREVDRRANADTALCFLLSTDDGKRALSKLDEIKWKRVVESVESGSFGDTPWSKSVRDLKREINNTVIIEEGQTTAICPFCGGVWTSNCKPKMKYPSNEMIMPTGPHCPHCQAIVIIKSYIGEELIK